MSKLDEEQAQYERDYARMMQADEYTLRHLASHLHSAGQREKLYRLLVGNKAWMEAKFARFAGDTEYVADLGMAIGDFHDPLMAEQLLVLAQLHTARQVVHARVSVYDDTDLKTLVWLGREQEALNHARLRSEPERQFYGLMAIFEAQKHQNHTDAVLLDSFLTVAHTILDATSRASALSKVAIALAANGRVEQALDVVQQCEEQETRVSALYEIAATLTQSKDARAVGVFTQAMRYAPGGSVTEIAVMLAKKGCFDQALKISEHIWNPRSREDCSRKIAVVMAESGHIDEALSTAKGFKFPSIRATTLADIAVILTQNRDTRATRVFEEALRILSREIHDPYDGSHAMSDIAIALARGGDKTAHNLLKQALENDAYFLKGWTRGTTLSSFAVALAENGDFDQALSTATKAEDTTSVLSKIASILANNGQVEQALRTIEDITHVERRANALREIALVLAQNSDNRATEIFERALNIDLTSGNDPTYAHALGTLATVLVRSGSLEQAIDIAESVQDEFRRAEACRKIAVMVACTGRLEQALSIVERIRGRTEYGPALCEIAAAAADNGCLEQALTIANRLPHTGWRVDALHGICTVLVKKSDLDQALNTAERIKGIVTLMKHAVTYVDCLNEIAVALAEDGQCEQAIEVAKRSERTDWCAQILSDIAFVLAKKGYLEQVLVTVKHIERAEWRVNAQCPIAIARARNGQIEGALNDAEDIESLYWRAEALREIAIVLAQNGDSRATEVFERAIRNAEDIESLDWRAEALREIAIVLAQNGDSRATEVFEQAARNAESIEDTYNPHKRVCTLRDLAVNLVQNGRIEQAMDLARRIEKHTKMDAYHRANIPREIIAAIVQSGCIESAFRISGIQDMDEFVLRIAQWCSCFEDITPGLSVRVLCEVLRICCWFDRRWQKAYDAVRTP